MPMTDRTVEVIEPSGALHRSATKLPATVAGEALSSVAGMR